MTVKEMRKETDMSQAEFAKYFGMPVRAIQSWEQEYRKPPAYVPAMMERILRLEGKL